MYPSLTDGARSDAERELTKTEVSGRRGFDREGREGEKAEREGHDNDEDEEEEVHEEAEEEEEQEELADEELVTETAAACADALQAEEEESARVIMRREELMFCAVHASRGCVNRERAPSGKRTGSATRTLRTAH